MLPLQQAYEVKHSILEYLKATFTFKDRKVNEAFYRFINDEENGMFKGPYISLKLPFVKTDSDIPIPLEIKPSFPPYDHQFKSFLRLNSRDGHTPESTLITTGTSSGKTECFLYPALDYCYQNIHRKGVKVIILYPMNALATDQAKRLAEIIWNDDRLKGKITAGLFIGAGKGKSAFVKEMGEKNIIEDRDTILADPPDILLTNFKMLDYGLMRNRFHNLWSHNLMDTSLLQYLVLDELHTYDGAQGTDVANLIRRLKMKLNISKGQICAVGTSATIGSGENSQRLLTEYAQKVFGEDFTEGAIITENRVDVENFFKEDDLDSFVPRVTGMHESRLKEDETYEGYIQRQKQLWQLPASSDPVKLSGELKKLKLVKDLLTITSKHIVNLKELISQLAANNPVFKKLPEWDNDSEINPREEVIQSLLALISEAKADSIFNAPFLFLQIQIWIRELSGNLREVGKNPNFTWRDKVPEKSEPRALPSYFCRECGASGWLGVKDDNKHHFYSDPKQVYEYFFNHHKNLYFINTPEHMHIEEYVPDDTINHSINPVDLSIHQKEEEGTFKIHAVRKLNAKGKSVHICPECNTENSVAIIGTRIATLSSISVAQVLSSDLDFRSEKLRKILAFTNSVQDAAHQASFIQARNYRFTFRSSLQKVLNQENRLLNIEEVQEAFINFWKQHSDETGARNEEAYYSRFFPSDYAGKADLKYDYRIGNAFKENFKIEFDERMHWEIAAEFGYNAVIGRTLEKTGTSAVKFEDEKIEQVFEKIKTWMEHNGLAMISEAQLLPFLTGILHRIRRRGGIDHSYLSKARNSRLSRWELNWISDDRHFLNKLFGPRSRFPKVIGTKKQTGEILDITFTQKNNWYHKYFTKSFELAPNHSALVNEFYQQLMPAFLSVGLMNKIGKDDDENFALNAKAIMVENKVKHFECGECGSGLSVALSDKYTAGTKCLDYTCTGEYKVSPKKRANYYQMVYNRNRSPRIYAAEHTGILERKDREAKEIDFKERPDFDSLNAVVATSTLEMGIDIGTLNTAINNSIPPLPSNFLQRVGRAGRSSGSALITNFAQNRAHDLYYYEEPEDMMEGEITTPGCYLEAKEILYRHFFAYCLDNWASADPDKHEIPKFVRDLRLPYIELTLPDFWSNRITSYIELNEDALLNRFVDFYKPDLQSKDGNIAVLESLKAFVKDGTFFERIRDVFINQKKEYELIDEKIGEIKKIIKEGKLPERDEERKILDQERNSLTGLKKLIDKRFVLEHLTNVGLLPNYAFPETGVTLNAWVNSNKAKASDGIPENKEFEIVRSASSAIRDFAPDNFFFSQGFKFAISGINTYDWKNPGTLLRKRFCSNCDHIANAALSNESACPKCGDNSWPSVKNQHVFLKLSGVKSSNTRDAATLDDKKDEREATFYRISRHLFFHRNSFQGAWGMKEIPFGIEYHKNVDIKEVNLGLSSSVNANKITINQTEEVPHHGFITCKYCGKSTSNSYQKEEYKWHYGYCKHKEKKYQGLANEVFEELFLFREIKTEGLKVLLPVQEFESEAQISMFKAGLELGFKKYYEGNPQHLNIVDYSEFNIKNSRFDKYLVIYDTIPGGTGYLEKLFDKTEFTKVITKAYEAIKNCSCQKQGKDGCYRCIYTYHNQYIQSELSRERAEMLFKKIVDKSNSWETFPLGLGSLAGTGQIEESELEERFIRSLRNFIEAKNDTGFRFENFMENGVINYKFKITSGEFVYHYVLRPQKDLGALEGVSLPTRADFFISLSAIERNGVSEIEQVDSFKKIAIYLDGYTYHGTKENLRFYDDLRKRLSIVESGDKISWTLTWSDLDKFDLLEKENDAASIVAKKDCLAIDFVKYKATIDKYKKSPYWQYKSGLLEKRNSFERLLWKLFNPVSENGNKELGLFFALSQQQFGTPSLDENEALFYLEDSSSTINPEQKANNAGNSPIYLVPVLPNLSGVMNVRSLVRSSDMEVKSALMYPELDGSSLDKEGWENFWILYNLIQESIMNALE